MSISDKLMNISNDDTQNCACCRLQLLVKSLDTQLNKPTNQNDAVRIGAKNGDNF